MAVVVAAYRPAGRPKGKPEKPADAGGAARGRGRAGPGWGVEAATLEEF